jgi:hypothetical protein
MPIEQFDDFIPGSIIKNNSKKEYILGTYGKLTVIK